MLDSIYIPIWLDLLYYIDKYNKGNNKNLHSNMVRFIIKSSLLLRDASKVFTFQYG